MENTHLRNSRASNAKARIKYGILRRQILAVGMVISMRCKPSDRSQIFETVYNKNGKGPEFRPLKSWQYCARIDFRITQMVTHIGQNSLIISASL